MVILECFTFITTKVGSINQYSHKTLYIVFDLIKRSVYLSENLVMVLTIQTILEVPGTCHVNYNSLSAALYIIQQFMINIQIRIYSVKK